MILVAQASKVNGRKLNGINSLVLTGVTHQIQLKSSSTFEMFQNKLSDVDDARHIVEQGRQQRAQAMDSVPPPRPFVSHPVGVHSSQRFTRRHLQTKKAIFPAGVPSLSLLVSHDFLLPVRSISENSSHVLPNLLLRILCTDAAHLALLLELESRGGKNNNCKRCI
jgi:hypothetical protein